jgi:hypothetical protein
MSLDGFMPKNAAFDKIANEATNPEALREAMKAELARQGIIARERGHEYGATVLHQPSAAAASDLALSDGRFSRIIYVGNTGLNLTAASGEELDRLEESVRGGQR